MKVEIQTGVYSSSAKKDGSDLNFARVTQEVRGRRVTVGCIGFQSAAILQEMLIVRLINAQLIASSASARSIVSSDQPLPLAPQTV